MPGLQKIFQAYGADYHTTMARFVGNEALYLRFLDLLFQDENLEKLVSSLDSGDLNRAFEAAHTLKGVTGNLGLTSLCEAVCRIVEPLRRGEALDYMELCQDIQLEFRRADQFRAALREGAST